VKNYLISLALISGLIFLISCDKKTNQDDKATVSITVSKEISENARKIDSVIGFHKTMSLYGITFDVKCPNNSSLNTVTITTKGLEIDNSTMIVEADGTVTDADIADIDLDGSPEVYVFVTNAGSGSYGSLIAYSANNKKSLSQIYLPDLMEDKKNSIGYAGHDEMAIIETTFSRRFKVYDKNYKPTSTVRQLQYKLAKGESGYVLKLDKTYDMGL
jgi:Periplasmic lysozyme inhibitor of I-type lysozyme